MLPTRIASDPARAAAGETSPRGPGGRDGRRPDGSAVRRVARSPLPYPGVPRA